MLEQVPDFIAIKRYGNSITALLERYADGVPSHIVALALDMSEPQVEARYQEIVLDLRADLGLS